MGCRGPLQFLPWLGGLMILLVCLEILMADWILYFSPRYSKLRRELVFPCGTWLPSQRASQGELCTPRAYAQLSSWALSLLLHRKGVTHEKEQEVPHAPMWRLERGGIGYFPAPRSVRFLWQSKRVMFQWDSIPWWQSLLRTESSGCLKKWLFSPPPPKSTRFFSISTERTWWGSWR